MIKWDKGCPSPSRGEYLVVKDQLGSPAWETCWPSFNKEIPLEGAGWHCPCEKSWMPEGSFRVPEDQPFGYYPAGAQNWGCTSPSLFPASFMTPLFGSPWSQFQQLQGLAGCLSEVFSREFPTFCCSLSLEPGDPIQNIPSLGDNPSCAFTIPQRSHVWYVNKKQRENKSDRKVSRWQCKFVVVQSLSRIWLFVNPWTAARQAPLSSTITRILLKFTSTGSVMLSNHLILCFSLLL